MGALALLLLPCAAVVSVGLVLSAPHPSEVGSPPAALVGAEAVSFPSASGTVVHGWLVPAAVRRRGAVVLLHGVWESRRRMVERARVLGGHGYAVLLVDLQAHGETPGRRVTFGRLEGFDAAAAVAYVRARSPGEPIGVIGFSLGGAAALLGPGPLAVDALVLESVYPDIDAALANRLRSHLGPVVGAVAAPVLTRLFEVLLPPLLGAGPSDLRPVDRIGEAVAPVLVVSGALDPSTPPDEARALFDHAREGRRELWIVDGAGHEDLERFGPAAYWARVLPFLARGMQGG